LQRGQLALPAHSEPISAAAEAEARVDECRVGPTRTNAAQRKRAMRLIQAIRIYPPIIREAIDRPFQTRVVKLWRGPKAPEMV